MVIQFSLNASRHLELPNHRILVPVLGLDAHEIRNVLVDLRCDCLVLVFWVPLFVVTSETLEHLLQLAIKSKCVAGDKMALVEFLLLLDEFVFVLQIVDFDIYLLLHTQEVVDLDLDYLYIQTERIVLLNLLLIVLLQLLHPLLMVVFLLPGYPLLILRLLELLFQVLNCARTLLVQIDVLHVNLRDFLQQFFVSGFLHSKVSNVFLSYPIAQF